IYAIARIVVAKDPLLAERKPSWSVKDRTTGGLWRDRIHSAWVDAYNDSVWIYSAQLAAEAVRLGFSEVQFDYVRFPDEPRERMATAIFPAHHGETQREAVREHITLLRNRLRPLGVPVTFDIFGLTASEIRPFLPAFTLGRRLPRYAPSQIRDQIRAAEDLGITSWVLWNPRSVYQRESLRPKHSGERSAGRDLSSTTGGR